MLIGQGLKVDIIMCKCIWQIPEELQYVQSITDKTNTADPLSGVVTILISVT